MQKTTIAPIPLEDLKEYFANKELTFLIDYENSTLKGEKFLTYLSNLDVPCDVVLGKDKDSILELVEVYMNTRMLVKYLNRKTRNIEKASFTR